MDSNAITLEYLTQYIDTLVILFYLLCRMCRVLQEGRSAYPTEDQFTFDAEVQIPNDYGIL